MRRLDLLGAFVCAAALAVFACGEDEEAQEGAATASAEKPAPSPTSSVGVDPERAPDAYAPVTEPQSARALTESERRVAEVLDMDPDGAGLGELMRRAREDADPAVREAAVIALGDSEEPRAVDALVAATEDPDRRVVLAAIDQLSWFDDRLAQDALDRLRESSDSEIAEAAEEALME